MGGAKRKVLAARSRWLGAQPQELRVVDTLGGRVHVRRDPLARRLGRRLGLRQSVAQVLLCGVGVDEPLSRFLAEDLVLDPALEPRKALLERLDLLPQPRVAMLSSLKQAKELSAICRDSGAPFLGIEAPFEKAVSCALRATYPAQIDQSAPGFRVAALSAPAFGAAAPPAVWLMAASAPTMDKGNQAFSCFLAKPSRLAIHSRCGSSSSTAGKCDEIVELPLICRT
jgi:hypothetical protein